MVSYFPYSMYRQQQQGPTPSGASHQFHHHPASPAGSWYAGFHQPSTPQPQQYLQDDQQWHHHHHHHHMFQPEWNAPEFVGGAPGMIGTHATQSAASLEDGQLPSSPITVSSSELSSPGAPGGTVSPSQIGHSRPVPARSPYEWMKKPSYQTQPNPGKTRTKDKYRVVYTDHQRLELEKEFHYSRYITIRRKAELAVNLGLSERQVKIWFQNRRAKERKQSKKREEMLRKENVDASNIHHSLVAHPQLAAAVAVAANGPPPSHQVVI